MIRQMSVAALAIAAVLAAQPTASAAPPAASSTEAKGASAAGQSLMTIGDGRLQGWATVNTTYQNGTPQSGNQHTGYNFYFGAANGTVPGGIKVRWVKCGSTSTQDGASAVGGVGKDISAQGTIGLVLGTSFVSGTCVRAWPRALSTAGQGGDFGFEQYFNSYVID